MNEPKPDRTEAQEHPAPDSFDGYDGPDHRTPEAADEEWRKGVNPPDSEVARGEPPY